MKDELERVRDWAKAKIRSGSEPHTWEDCVKLIEAADAILHDMSVAANSAASAQRSERHLRHTDRADTRH